MEEKTFPFVSILLAVRNEEADIANCLDSLLKQDYPSIHFEILVGNDNSTDNTAQIVAKYEKRHKNIKLLLVDKNLNGLYGKANVLAFLAKKAMGEFFLFTDADMLLPNSWIGQMLELCNEDTGVVNGFTLPKVFGVFSAMQSLDWLLAQKQLQLFNQLDIPVTAMGNNMLVRKAAYDSTGGYESLGYSITEDYQLFSEIVAKGWGFGTAYNQLMPSVTLPEKTLNSLCLQRLRWMTGAFNLPFILLSPLILNAITLPIIIVLFLFSPVIGTTFFLFRWLTVSLFLFFTILHAKQYSLLKYFLFYDLYNLMLSFTLLVLYVIKVEIIWKGRNYDI